MKLNQKLAASLLGIAMLAQVGMTSMADEVEKGELTNNNPVAWGMVSFPFRVVTGAAGMGVGAVAGGLKGIVDTEKKFAENTFGQADENPLLVPVGLIGSVVAVPVGFLAGFPEQAVKTGQDGFQYWDRF